MSECTWPACGCAQPRVCDGCDAPHPGPITMEGPAEQGATAADDVRRFAAALPTWQRAGFHAAIDRLVASLPAACEQAEPTAEERKRRAIKYADAQVGWQTRQTMEALQDANEERNALFAAIDRLATRAQGAPAVPPRATQHLDRLVIAAREADWPTFEDAHDRLRAMLAASPSAPQAAPSEEQEREAFEAWFFADDHDLLGGLEAMWTVWQARSRLPAPPVAIQDAGQRATDATEANAHPPHRLCACPDCCDYFSRNPRGRD